MDAAITSKGSNGKDGQECWGSRNGGRRQEGPESRAEDRQGGTWAREARPKPQRAENYSIGSRDESDLRKDVNTFKGVLLDRMRGIRPRKLRTKRETRKRECPKSSRKSKLPRKSVALKLGCKDSTSKGNRRGKEQQDPGRSGREVITGVWEKRNLVWHV